jgi:hydroxyethylthiazole kinase-like uncharacterized protein yjeF
MGDAKTNPPLNPPFVLAPRDARGHKGTFGRVAVVGGCCAGVERMAGAPCLAGAGALRAGAGLVKVFLPEALALACLATLPSAMAHALACDERGAITIDAALAGVSSALEWSDCTLVGPGLAIDAQRKACLAITRRAVLSRDAGPRGTRGGDGAPNATRPPTPVVLDADGLNALSELARERAQDGEPLGTLARPCVLTPHPGECARLASALGLDVDLTSDAGRLDAAQSLAQRLGCVVVLKGAGTVVADGSRAFVNATGSNALATGGTGDVLGGVIAGLVAGLVKASGSTTTSDAPAGASALFEPACVAVWAHGLASDRWRSAHGAQAGLLAMELAALIPGALERARR